MKYDTLDSLPCDAEAITVIAEFFRYISIEKQLSHNTAKAYLEDVRSFTIWLSSHISCSRLSLSDLEEIDINDLRSWLAHRIANKISHRSNARSISAIKSLFIYLGNNNIINNIAIFGLRRPRLPKLLPKAISYDQICKMLNIVQLFHSKHTWQNARDTALLTLIFATGIRISEAVSLCKHDLASEIFYVQGKGNKTRVVPMLPIVKEAISRYLEVCPFNTTDSSHVFFSNLGNRYTARMAQKMLCLVRPKLGIGVVTPHTLRHSCATALLGSSGDDIQKIQRLLGHASLSTTQIYTKINKKILRDAMSALQ